MERPKSWTYWTTTVVASVSTATLLRLLLNPILGERAVFLLAVLAVALSAHLAGLSAGVATIVVAIPVAAVVSGPGPAAPGTTPEWVQMALAISLALPLAYAPIERGTSSSPFSRTSCGRRSMRSSAGPTC